MSADHYKQHDEIYKVLEELTQAVRNLEKRAMERDQKVDEMFKFFNNGAIIGRAILFAVKWSFIIFTSLGSTYLMYKQGFQDKIF